MVNITDFFGKQKGATPKRKVVKKPEVIDLDDDDDDILGAIVDEPEEQETKPAETKKEIPVIEKKQLPTSPPVVEKKAIVAKEEAKPIAKPATPKSNKPVTAQDVLDSIPSLDLNTVHVKENATFDFRQSKQQSNDSGMAMDVDIPEGQDNCLLGLTIVFTGTLPSIERGAAENLAKRYGARVTKSISKKTSVVVLGDEAGPKKLEKIKDLGIKAIDEEGFKQLIAGMPADGGSGDAAEKAKQKLEEQEREAIRQAEEMDREEKQKKWRESVRWRN